MRTNVYIDGFNLYYGVLRATPFRWLDLRALCMGILPKHEIHQIRYFTARVSPRPNNPKQHERQDFYLQALSSLPGLSIHYGHFLSHPVRMHMASPPPPSAMVIKTEEKGSDVNLAAHLLFDAFKGNFEQALVISNDSDLLEPIRMVRDELKLPVGVAFPLRPGRTPSRELVQAATFTREIRKNLLARSQFPPVVDSTIHKPSGW